MHRRKHEHQFIIYCSNPHWGCAQRLMRDDVLFKFGTWKRKRMALNSNISDERMKPEHALNFMFLSIVLAQNKKQFPHGMLYLQFVSVSQKD